MSTNFRTKIKDNTVLRFIRLFFGLITGHDHQASVERRRPRCPWTSHNFSKIDVLAHPRSRLGPRSRRPCPEKNLKGCRPGTKFFLIKATYFWFRYIFSQQTVVLTIICWMVRIYFWGKVLFEITDFESNRPRFQVNFSVIF